MILTYIFNQGPVAETPAAKSERPRTAVRVLAILKACGREWDVAPSLLTGARRQSYITEARHAAMALLREEGLTQEDIGAIFRRDHTTVIHAVRKHGERMRSPRYAERFARVREGL
ncbi:helix-turn-helix domain-containing protein [Luteolibacter sp. LG18]|uniref:helix-turn-helix domain-containing protein n=1 Tax=Luteolibacter sp. LG18 TaxID=2819286 RepID=UPI002B282729|nr:hypothetical protein llg_27030 [Luteolibacter sp. LG18]